MPPPIIAILFMLRDGSGCHAHLGSCQTGQRRDERWRSVQRFRPPHQQSLLRGEFLEADVHIIEHLNVVAHKTDRCDDHALVALLLKFEYRALYRRPQPRPARHALALKGKVLKLWRKARDFSSYQARCLLGLLLVGIAGLNSPLRAA